MGGGGIGVRVGVSVGVGVSVEAEVGVSVCVGVLVGVCVAVAVGVGLRVGDGVSVDVGRGDVGVGELSSVVTSVTSDTADGTERSLHEPSKPIRIRYGIQRNGIISCRLYAICFNWHILDRSIV